MAAGIKSVDITLCAICLKILDIPKCLPCLHTFCEKCIASYIASLLKKGDKTDINCPVCRTNLLPPLDNCSPEDWAKRLPLNFLIVGLMEKQKIKRAEKQCMSCERLGKSTTAVFVCVECSDALCDNCYQYHKANKFTSRHKTVSITDISEVERSLNFFRSDCPEHTNEELKLFCVDHDVPCCSLCVSVTHRKCNEVVTIDQAAQGFMTSDVAENIEQTLANVEKDALVLIAHNKKCEESITTQFDISDRNIDSYFAELQTRIKIVKLNIKDKLIKISNEKKDTVETNITMLENLTKRVENEKMILKASLQKASPVQVMIETKKLKTKQELHKKTVSQAYENTFDYKLVFKCDQEIVKLTMGFEDNVSVACETGASMLELVTVPAVKLKLKCKINYGCLIIDCFCNGEQQTVILDSNNQVSSYDASGNQMYVSSPYYAVNYGYTPTAIAEGDFGEIVVAYIEDSAIEIMNQNGNILHQTNISFAAANSIAMHRGQQLLIASDGTTIGISRKSGEHIHSFGSIGATYLCINSQPRLYYVESNNLICKTLEGINEFTTAVESKGGINGLSVDPKGNIFVSSTQNNTISLLSTSGSIRADILTEKDGLSRPSCVRCSFDGKTLLVVNKNKCEILCFEIL